MILLCGIPSETPLRLVTTRLEESGAPFVMFNQRDFGSAEIEFDVSQAGVQGFLRIRTRPGSSQNSTRCIRA